MLQLLIIISGAISGNIVRRIINWLNIEDFTIKQYDLRLEIIGALCAIWSFSNLSNVNAMLFISFVLALSAISIIDLYTYRIPLLFILLGLVLNATGIILGNITFEGAIWGIFIGAIIPLIIMGSLWMVTKRQGMGYGDIQLGFVLGAWLGPMRMAITLFVASLMSLLVWIGVSIFRGFDRDLALPFGPFLSIAGISAFVGSYYYPELFYLLTFE